MTAGCRRSPAVRLLFFAPGIDFGTLGKKESCCGDPAKRLGEDGVLEEIIIKNFETFESAGCRQVVTTCPHGLKMLRDEYPVYYRKLGLESESTFQVEHYTELLSRLVREGKLSFDKPLTSGSPITTPATWAGTAEYLSRPAR